MRPLPRPGSRGPGTGRRRAVVVAFACVAVVALVAASIFSIQHRSREVVGHAGALHSLDETLRSITVARSQAAFAAYLASVDARYGTDSRDVIDGALADARRGVADALTADEAAGAAAGGSRALLDDFSGQAQRTIALVEAGRPAAARRATEGLDTIFERMRADLVTRRDHALELIAADDDRLWRLGALASFIAAFVVPCGIVFVYLILTRRSRSAVEAQIARDRERAQAERRREGTEAAIRALRAAILEAGRNGAPVPMEPLDDLAALLRAADATTSLDFTAVPLGPLLEEIAAAPGTEALAISVRAAGETAWADRAALLHVVSDLVLEARAGGARRVTLVAGAHAEYAQISVLHDGAPLPPAVAASLAGSRSGLLDPVSEGPRPSTRLLAAAAVAAGMGGDLHSTHEPGPAMMVRIPRAGQPVPAGPAPTAPAAAPA